MKTWKNDGEYKKDFMRAHANADWKVDTSGLREDGTYVKTYIFTDGAQMTQVCRPVWEQVEATVEVRGLPVKIKDTIKLMEIELWNTDNAESVKFYERW